MELSNLPESHDVALEIIAAVKNHPVLYIDAIKETSIDLMEFRRKVWQYISSELNIDENTLKAKWENLRDTYSRILKYKNKNDAGVMRKKWIFEDALSFLTSRLNPESEQVLELSEEYIKVITKHKSIESLSQQPDGNNDENNAKISRILNDPKITVSQRESKKKTQINEKERMQKLLHEIESRYRKIRPKLPLPENNFNVISNVIVNLPASSQIPVTNPDLVSSNTQSKRPIVEDLKETPQVECKKLKTRLQVFFGEIADMVEKLPLDVQFQVRINICQRLEEIEAKHKKQKEKNESVFRDSESLPKMVLIPCSMIDKINNIG